MAGTHFLHSSRKRYSMLWPSHEAGSENVRGRASKEVETTGIAVAPVGECGLWPARNDDGTDSSATSPTMDGISQEINAERALCK